eukprot:TRINITY_DN19553_c0_g1_i2.p1 TRINITY_DN19553_c0_g1~~TRINITY_DN19553_c0_g1_i2.p1  ORF type:complete len:497 (+),score=125.17 TRINITY_DN19553_c0_g1_i2:97-1587(+)
MSYQMSSPRAKKAVGDRERLQTPQHPQVKLDQYGSIEKLKSLKVKLQKDLAAAVHERQCLLNEEAIVPLSLVDEYKDTKGKKGRGKDPVQSGEQRLKLSHPKGSAKQRDIGLLFETQEKEKRTLELHNQRLKNLIELRQQSSKRTEDRVEQQIGRLKSELDRTVIVGDTGHTETGELKSVNKSIQNKIEHLQTTIEKQAEIDKMNIVRQYRVRMHELKKELEEEQQQNYTGAQEWIEKNNFLKGDLDEATATLERVVESNQHLREANKELKKKFKQQEEERNTVIKQITSVKKENKRLAEHVEALEEEAVQIAKKVEAASPKGTANTYPPLGSRVSLNRPGSGTTHKATEYTVKYLEMINKVKRQLEQERRTLKQVRSSHIELLQERTEMEVFLRQCLNDVRKEISRTSSVTAPLSTPVTDYTTQDRKNRLTLLASKERVLFILYSRTFPYKTPQDAVPVELEENSLPLPSVLSSSAELDMDTLWKKWKTWTEKGI